jgi:hypothetical protein
MLVKDRTKTAWITAGRQICMHLCDRKPLGKNNETVHSK